MRKKKKKLENQKQTAQDQVKMPEEKTKIDEERKKSRGFKRKTVLIVSFVKYFLIFLIIIFSGLGLVIRIAANRMVFQSMEQELEIVADSIEDTISVQIQGVQNLVYAYAQNSLFAEALIKGDFYDIDPLLQRMQSYDMIIDHVFVTDTEGTVLAANQFDILRQDVSGSRYFKAVVENRQESYADRVASVSPTSGNLVLVFANPITYNWEVVGMLAISVDLGSLREQRGQ